MVNETKTEKVCAFCDKKQTEVNHLIASHADGPMICDECIGLSVDILTRQFRKLYRDNKQLRLDLKAARACLLEAVEFAEEIVYGDFMPNPGTTQRWREALGEIEKPDESEDE